jgi:hypothetical protein
VADLAAKKIEALRLEDAGQLRDALHAYREIVTHCEAGNLSADLVPALFKVCEITASLGDRQGGLAVLTQAADRLADAGDADAVVAIVGRLADVEPQLTGLPARFARRLLDGGHAQGARAVLLDVARRRHRPTAQHALELMEAWPDDDVARQLRQFLDRAGQSARTRGSQTASRATVPPAAVPPVVTPPAPTPVAAPAPEPTPAAPSLAIPTPEPAPAAEVAREAPPSRPLPRPSAPPPAPVTRPTPATAPPKRPSAPPAGRPVARAARRSAPYLGWLIGAGMVGFAGAAVVLVFVLPGSREHAPGIEPAAPPGVVATPAPDTTVVTPGADSSSGTAEPGEPTPAPAARDTATVQPAPTPQPTTFPRVPAAAPRTATPEATARPPTTTRPPATRAPAEPSPPPAVSAAAPAAAPPTATAPALPPSLRVDRTVVIVEGLRVVAVDAGGRDVRISQLLDSGDTLQLRVSDLGPSSLGVGTGRILVSARPDGGSQGTARIGQYLVTARAALATDALEQLLQRLVEIRP